jgi:myo-inositol-1(or 4)-monophosphatase
MYDINLMKELLLSAGERAMQHFHKVTPSWKENKTYVTAADLEVQEYLKKALEQHYPDDGIIAEEQDLAKEPASGNRYWVIDPIDGTASFAHGFPIWGIAVGLLTPTEPLGGFFYMPTTDDFYYTLPDGTVHRNDQITALRPPDAFGREAVLLSGARFHRRYNVSSDYRGKIRSLGSIIAHICYVATGSADAAFIPEVPVWDLAAGLAMLHHNQGVLEYFDGTAVALDTLLAARKAAQPMLAGHPETIRQYREFLSFSPQKP